MKKFLLCALVALLTACGDSDSDFVQRPEGTSEKSQKSSSSGSIVWNTEISYGEMTDARNDRTYRTVKIGKQTWMAENLNLEMKGAYCYDYDSRKCDEYGRFYDWPTAVGRVDCNYKDTCGVAPVVQGVCPDGWHLPSLEEWDALIEFVGGDSVAGAKLRSINGWSYSKVDGSDIYCFRALPGGIRRKNSTRTTLEIEGDAYIFTDMGEAGFWVSTEVSKAWVRFVYVKDADVVLASGEKGFWLTVRCIMNSDEFSPDPNEHFEIPQVEIVGFEPGSMTDSRDGQIYRTVSIGSQTWMAENLNYRYTQETAELDSSSFLCKDEIDGCEEYGRYYLWSAAMDSAGIFSEDGLGCGNGVLCSRAEKVRGVCPEGWHLPDTLEWRVLIDAAGGTYEAGKILKSTEGWKDDCNGTDDYGFSVWPTLLYRTNKSSGHFDWNIGMYANMWSSTEIDSVNVFMAGFRFDNEVARLAGAKSGKYKDYALPIRCVMD